MTLASGWPLQTLAPGLRPLRRLRVQHEFDQEAIGIK
jgi:hypothetical protein